MLDAREREAGWECYALYHGIEGNMSMAQLDSRGQTDAHVSDGDDDDDHGDDYGDAAAAINGDEEPFDVGPA